MEASFLIVVQEANGSGSTHEGYCFVCSLCEDGNATLRFLSLYCRDDVFRNATRHSVRMVAGSETIAKIAEFKARNTFEEDRRRGKIHSIELADVNCGRGVYWCELARDDIIIGYTRKPYDFTYVGYK